MLKYIRSLSFCFLAFFMLSEQDGCDGTHTPGPTSQSTTPPALSWFLVLQTGDYQLVIESTNKISEQSPYYLEARLYLGIARLAYGQSHNSQESLDSAVKDLLFVRDNFKLSNSLKQREQFLLYRALMVITLISKPSNINQANGYLDQAVYFVKSNENLKKAVQEEYQEIYFNSDLRFEP